MRRNVRAAPERRVEWHLRARRTSHRGGLANTEPLGSVYSTRTGGMQGEAERAMCSTAVVTEGAGVLLGDNSWNEIVDSEAGIRDGLQTAVRCCNEKHRGWVFGTISATGLCVPPERL